MLSNAFKLLFLAMALVCVAAIPEFEHEFPLETEADEMDAEDNLDEVDEEDEVDNVDMDDSMTKEERQLNIRPPFIPKPGCPFDCGKVCVVKYPFTWGNPPVSNYFYLCHRNVYYCCKRACYYYQRCLSSKPAWVCYADTLDRICRCRRRRKPNIKFEIKQGKGK